MNILANLSIKQKLMFIIMTTIIVTLSVLTAALIYLEYKEERRHLTERFETLSNMIAKHSTAAITFQDQETATQMLASLTLDESFNVACIYTPANELFAVYSIDQKSECNTEIGQNTIEFDDNYLHLSKPITLNNKNIGTLYLTDSLDELHERMLLYSTSVIILICIVGIGAYFLANIMQTFITNPIVTLKKVTEQIADQGDYSHSVPHESSDEIGNLYQSFNKMIEQIQSRDIALKSSEQLLRNIIDGLGPQMFVGLLQTDGTLIEVNKPALDIAGLNPDDVIGKHVVDTFWLSYSGVVRHQFHNTIERALRGERSRYDLKIRVGENQFAFVDFSMQPLRNESGQVVYLVSSAIDISERKLAEEELKLFKTLIDHSNDAIEVINPKTGHFIDVNQKGCTDLGYSLNELRLLRVADIDPTIDQSAWPQLMEELRNKKARSWDGIHRRKDGTTLPVEVNIKWVDIDEGYVVAVARDISERKRAAEELNHERGFSESVLNSLPGVVYCYDKDLKFLRWNANLENVLGYSHDEIANMSPLDFFDGEHRKLIEERSHEVFDKGISDAEAEFLTKDGRLIPYYFTGHNIEIYGKSCLIGVGIDISKRKQAEEKLKEKEQQLRLFVKHSPAAIAMFDNKMNYIVVSNRWLSDYGLTNEDIIGYCHYDIFPNIPERWKEVHQRCLQGASESNDEETFLRADGTINWIRWDILPWYSTNGGIGGIIIFTEDITKRKESEEIRYELMNRNEALVKALGEIVYDWRPPEDRLTWEGDYTRILGYTPDEIGTVTASWEERIHPDDLPDVLAEVENAIRQHRNFEFEYQFRRKDGSYCWMNDRGVSYFDEQGKLTRMIGVFSDISQRKKIEEDLIKSEQSLRNLVTRLQEVREEERTHISREIHDELGQSLTGIRIDLSWILDQLSEEKEDLINRAKMAILLADQTIDSVQRLSLDLRPLILDDLGLQAAVEWHINEFIRRTDCQCNLDLKLNGIVFDDKHATAIFRILQEALTNVSRHAGATEVNISLQVNDGQFFMDIFDNGCGIETKEMNSSESIGLTGMRERADAIGAHIEFLKHYSGGTHVRLKLSVEPAREATT